jgi:hypothetical protein
MVGASFGHLPISFFDGSFDDTFLVNNVIHGKFTTGFGLNLVILNSHDQSLRHR